MLLYLIIVPLITSVLASTGVPDTLCSPLKVFALSPSRLPNSHGISDAPLKVCEAINSFSNDLPLLENALNDGIDFNVSYLPDQYPLYFSIISGHQEIFDLLVHVDVS